MLNLPSAKHIGIFSLEKNKKLRILNMPRIELIGAGFLNSNRRFKNKTVLDFIDNVRVDIYDQINNRSGKSI